MPPTVTETKTFPFTKVFREWRALKGQEKMVTDRMNKLKVGLAPNGKPLPSTNPGEGSLLAAIMELGEEIDGGHLVWNFRTPVEYTEGKATHVYTGLKAEKRLVPATPTPDPDLAEELLRKKDLWMTPDQERMLDALRLSCPNVTFTAEPDIDAVSALYIKKTLTEKEYQATLPEQSVQWAFVPQEVK